MIVVALILFIFIFTLPFLPAIMEIIRKEDADPLYIAMNYKKDPRYFGKSFKHIIQNGILGLPAGSHTSEVMLSKKENIQITESINIPAAERIENLLCVQGNLVSAANVHFNTEVYVSGESDIGPGNLLHVLAADGNITIAENTTFVRWLDTDGNLNVGANCHLGISASCGGKLSLANDCSFRRLYGMPITTGHAGDAAEINLPAAWPLKQPAQPALSFIRKNDSTIPPDTILNSDVVFLKDVRIGCRSVINGSIKCHGEIELEDNITICGNIFAEGNITIGKGAVISGHVFSQNAILISENSFISRPGVVKSVIGKKSVCLAPQVAIFGFISTEGEGTVL